QRRIRSGAHWCTGGCGGTESRSGSTRQSPARAITQDGVIPYQVRAIALDLNRMLPLGNTFELGMPLMEVEPLCVEPPREEPQRSETLNEILIFAAPYLVI